MKESGDGHRGLLAWSFGFASLFFAIIQPLAGVILGVVGLVLSKNKEGEWNRVAKILSIVGIIGSVAVTLLGMIAFKYLANNPGLITGLQ